jgi:hypothetical protein
MRRIGLLTAFCVMIAATPAMAWLRLADVPHIADVDSGAHLVWGDGLVWGVFPTEGNHVGTYLFTYDPDQFPDPDSAEWDTTLPMMSGAQLSPCNITFQPGANPTLWGIGATGGTSYLKHYFEGADHWDEATIDSFDLDSGATIAFAPNAAFDETTNAIPGSIYCLPGDDSSFWRYNVAVRDLPDPGQYGMLYPHFGATIADPKPPFRWLPEECEHYRVQVSADPTFSAALPVIDTVVTAPEFKSAIELPNNTYYWRVAGGNGLDWQWYLVTNWSAMPPLALTSTATPRMASGSRRVA